MKNFSTTCLFVFCLSSSFYSHAKTDPLSDTNSTTETNTEKHFYVGIGFGIGIFYPGDVNDYISNETSNYFITTGVAEIFANYVGRVSLTYRINSSVDVTLIGEFGWAPKYIALSNGDDIFYQFNRLSPGLIPKFHIPLRSGQNSFFLSPGVLYHSMKFEDFKGSSMGFRVTAGLSFNFNWANLQPFISYDFATANDEFTNFELNYSGAQIGVDLHF